MSSPGGYVMHANPKFGVPCLDCGHREMIRRSWLGRSSRVRCVQCAGPVNLSLSTRRALLHGMDLARTRKEQIS